MSKEAMKLALEALETAWTYDEDNADGYYFEAITALREALAKPDFWEGYVPEPVKPAQHEPDWLDKEQTETDWDHVWLLIKAANYASSKGFISGTTNWGSAVSRYMRHESPQPAQRTWVGLTDGERNGLWRVIVGWGDPSHDDVDLMKAIEEALRKKNS